MQQLVLFRKLVIDNKNYYQLYDIKEKCELSEQFGNYLERNDKDYFYLVVDEEQSKIFQNSKYMIFSDFNNELNQVFEKKELEKTFQAFKEKFNDLNDINLQFNIENYFDQIYDNITNDVLFQDDAIIEILEVIARNQDILNSNASDDIKKQFKDNIILMGLPNTGKKTIFKTLQENLDIPYAEITLTPDLETNVTRVFKQLIETANGNLELANNGIVYVHDNIDQLANYNENLSENPYMPLLNLMNGIKLTIGEQKEVFDINKLTFIIALDISSLEEIEDYMLDIRNIPNTHVVNIVELTPTQQKTVLLKSKKSVINIYRNILKSMNKKLVIEKGFLDELILASKNIDGGMKFVNDVINRMVKLEWYNDENSVNLTIAKLKEVLKYFDEDIDKIENLESYSSKSVETNKELDYDLEQLVEIVKQNVRSQDEHVKRILYTVLRNRYAANNKDLENPKRYVKNILIRGESGSGKTLILTEVSKLLKLPIFIADATSYTEEGYVGNSVNDMLASLYKAANGDLEKAQKGILVIDEIDKKSAGGTDNNVTRGAVLDGLLKIIEGTVVPLEIGKGFNAKQLMFDTSRLTVICSGAFENIEQIRESRLGVKKTMGFGSKPEAKPDQDPKIIDEDYVKYGMNRQFMARLGVIVNLNKLMPEDLKNIMINSKTSELVIQKKIAELEGLELEYEDSFYEALSQKAFNKKIGARGIEKAFNEVLDNIKFIDINPMVYSKVIFTGECIDDPTKIILIEREKAKELVKKKD